MIAVKERSAPLILCIGHSGLRIPPAIDKRLSATGRLQADASWHMDQLVDFAEDIQATVVSTPISRLVVDVDGDPASFGRPFEDGALSICPVLTLEGKRVYLPDEDPGRFEMDERRRLYHAPFHDALSAQIRRLRAIHGRITVISLQSMRSRIKGRHPGDLPLVNIGTLHGRSCHEDVASLSMTMLHDFTDKTFSENDAVGGGYIAQTYGNPSDGVHVLTLALALRSYIRHENPPFEMDRERCRQTRLALRNFCQKLIEWANGKRKAPARVLLDHLPDLLED